MSFKNKQLSAYALAVKENSVFTERPTALSPYQKLLLAFLVFLQFTVVVDFMVISPLGVMIIPDLKISAQQFGVVVSAYAFSAALAALLASGFSDQFDRKKLLIFFYTGFMVGTLFCGLSYNYETLVLSRAFTGFFGGVIGSIVLSIVADLFPYKQRGIAMGFVQSAFASSQILGIPLGILLSEKLGWRVPFYSISGLGLLVGIAIIIYLKPIREHLKTKKAFNPFKHMLETVTNKSYLVTYLSVALLITGGFMIMPFSSAYMVNNLQLSVPSLTWIYISSGCVSLLFGPLIGRLSDQFGKYPIFIFGCVLTITGVLTFTNLAPVPLAVVALVNIILFIGVTARIVTSQALNSAIPETHDRGSFMNINSAVQMLAGGIASVLAGYLVHIEPDGQVGGFWLIGICVSCTCLMTIGTTYVINKKVTERLHQASQGRVETEPVVVSEF